MKRVVITGNAGGGKTRLANRLAAATGLPLIFLDQLLWKPGWQALPPEDFRTAHQALIEREEWIIEGVGYDETLAPRFEMADTIIFLDFPLWRHYWWAAKRQIACLFKDREDWVDGCPMLPKTVYIARIIWAIHTETTQYVRERVTALQNRKAVFHITSLCDLRTFTQAYC